MRLQKKSLALFLILVLSLTTFAPIGISAEPLPVGEVKEYLVVTDGSLDYQQLSASFYSDSSNQSEYELEALQRNNIALVTMNDAEINTLRKMRGILFIEENRIISTSAINDESETDYAWNLKAIHATPNELGELPDCSQVKVAVLDSGICVTEELNMKQSVDLVTEENVIPFDADGSGHGTAVAGIIGAQNDGIGITGVCPGVTLYSVKIFNEGNKAPLSRVIAGIQWAIDRDVNIINMSFGTEYESYALHKVIQQASNKGILMIAAAGNHYTTEYPAAFPEVIMVGATDALGQRVDYSACGDGLELMAPGQSIMTTSFFDGYTTVSGTSMASAHVAGAAALLWAKDLTKPAGFIRKLLQVSANPMMNQNREEYGYGLLDVKYALNCYEKVADGYYAEEILVDKNTTDVIPLETNVFLEGSWGGRGHEDLVIDSTAGTTLTAYQKMIMRKAVRLADDAKYSAATKYIGLHAGGMHEDIANGTSINYVQTLLFLYHAAYLLKNNPNVNYNTVIDNAARDIKTRTNCAINDAIIDAAKLVSGDIFEFYDNQYNDKSKYPQNTNEERAFKVLGFALHLSGDIYAHRTIVPIASINNTVNGNANTIIDGNFYNLYDFDLSNGQCSDEWIKETAFNKGSTVPKCLDHRWNCFVRGVSPLYVIEFCDIKWFTKERSRGGNNYEDNVHFYASRYSVGANYTCKYIISKFVSNVAYLDNKVLLPGANGRNFSLKLCALQEFYQAVGFSWDSNWDKYSVALR